MANWIENVVFVSGLDAETSKVLLDDGGGLGSRLMPQPADVVGDEAAIDWRNRHWGTATDPNFTATLMLTGAVRLSFTTAWAPPVGLFQTLEERGASVRAYYLDETEGTFGKYSGGEDTYAEYDYEDGEFVSDDPALMAEVFAVVGPDEGAYEDDDGDE